MQPAATHGSSAQHSEALAAVLHGRLLLLLQLPPAAAAGAPGLAPSGRPACSPAARGRRSATQGRQGASCRKGGNEAGRRCKGNAIILCQYSAGLAPASWRQLGCRTAVRLQGRARKQAGPPQHPSGSQAAPAARWRCTAHRAPGRGSPSQPGTLHPLLACRRAGPPAQPPRGRRLYRRRWRAESRAPSCAAQSAWWAAAAGERRAGQEAMRAQLFCCSCTAAGITMK